MEYGTVEVTREDGVVVVRTLENRDGKVFISAYEKESGKVLATNYEINTITVQEIEIIEEELAKKVK